MATKTVETTLVEAYRHYTNLYVADCEITCTMREVGEFVDHIHRSLQEHYDFTPKSHVHLSSGPADVGVFAAHRG